MILDSADTPGKYREDVARALSNNPGALYLRTDLSCPSLRQAGERGYPIYAVYRPAVKTSCFVRRCRRRNWHLRPVAGHHLRPRYSSRMPKEARRRYRRRQP